MELEHSSYLVGYFLGGLFVMGGLSHLPYFALKRLVPTKWVAVALSPVLLYGLCIWSFWDKGIAEPTIFYSLGAILFVRIRHREVKGAVGRTIALALGGMAALLAIFGPTTEFNKANEASVVLCRDGFRETGVTGADHEALTRYCRCGTEWMLGPECKKFSLLWSNSAAKQCGKRAEEELATPAGAVQFEARKDICLHEHLPSQAAQFIAFSRRRYVEVGVRQMLEQPDTDKSDLLQDVKNKYARCYMEAVMDACPSKTLAGYAGCFHSTPSSQLGAECGKILDSARKPKAGPLPRASEWITIDTPHFRVPFPAKVAPTEETLPVNGMHARLMTWLYEIEGGAFSISYVEYPTGFGKNQPPSRLLTGARDGFLANTGGKLKRETLVLLDSQVPRRKWPGRQCEASAPGGYSILSRMYLVENHLYQLTLVYSDDSLKAEFPRMADGFTLKPGHTSEVTRSGERN